MSLRVYKVQYCTSSLHSVIAKSTKQLHQQQQAEGNAVLDYLSTSFIILSANSYTISLFLSLKPPLAFSGRLIALRMYIPCSNIRSRYQVASHRSRNEESPSSSMRESALSSNRPWRVSLQIHYSRCISWMHPRTKSLEPSPFRVPINVERSYILESSHTQQKNYHPNIPNVFLTINKEEEEEEKMYGIK